MQRARRYRASRPASTLGGSATVVNTGTLSQTFAITLGNGSGATSIDNLYGLTYDIVFDQGDDLAISSDGSATIDNGGLFEKTVGTGIDRVDARFVDTDAGKNGAGTVALGGGATYTFKKGAGTVLLRNQAGAVYNVTFDQGDDNALLTGGGGAFDNAGLFEKTVGVGVDRIDTTFTDESTGTVDVQGGTVYFHGASVFKGLVTGTGAVWLGGGTQQTLDSGTSLSVATLAVVDSGTDLVLDASLTYAGTFDENGGTSLTLAGTTLTLAAGSTANVNGFIGGTGKLLA